MYGTFLILGELIALFMSDCRVDMRGFGCFMRGWPPGMRGGLPVMRG